MARVRRPARPPAPLLALLGVVATLVVAGGLVSPPFQAPDETEHFSYVQTLAELHRLPGGAGQPYSTELSHATDVTNLVQATVDPYATPDWPRLRADVWGATDTGSRTDGGGTNTASTYPPLYYGLEAIAYRAAADGHVFTRLSVVRLTSGLWA